MSLQPFEWKDRPALIEHLFPVQKISAESYKEQMANQGKTLTSLGSYWKGRKPLVLNKACILGALLPVTDDSVADLHIFELLMGIDQESMRLRIEDKMPVSRRAEIGQYLTLRFSEQLKHARRVEEMDESLLDHVWTEVNSHLGTSSKCIEDLVEEMGVARFGRRPRVADVFSGSGQIPFEAARLGCDVHASDLNPVAALLTWGSLNLVGASGEDFDKISIEQNTLVHQVKQRIDELGIEPEIDGWKPKAYLYCNEVICPESGWKVPLMTTFVVSEDHMAIVNLRPEPESKSYQIEVRSGVSKDELAAAKLGTVQDGSVIHSPMPDEQYRVKISTIRGDVREGKVTKSKLRLWEKEDFFPRESDIYQERLYCIQWIRQKENSSHFESSFRGAKKSDFEIERNIRDFLASNISEWQRNGFIPDMVIEAGDKTDEPIRTRGWTHWHHLFNPRQLLILGLIKQYTSEITYPAFAQSIQYNSRLCRWCNSGGGRAGVIGTFDNQALNTLYNYGCRAFDGLSPFLKPKYKNYPINTSSNIETIPAGQVSVENDIYVTDPPYGDAVKYEEITEFFIGWLRKNPPAKFANWVWDSRRSLSVKGEDEGFRRGMIAAYRSMANNMPDNGLQVLMFTHQSGAIWADMANIIWASGLQVSAAWYVVTETDNALRQGSNVKGTIILILRKRHKDIETFRDDLGWEIEDAVREQVESLIGLDKKVREQGSEGLYTDADLQMAGYAAALKVLTAYSHIDGKDMVVEAEAPKPQGKKTFVDDLIEFAVQSAVQFLVPVGFEKSEWQKLQSVERFYLKMMEMEHQGAKTLDNYQNFAKAFKVHHFDQLMSDSSKANSARLKLSTEFKSSMMSGDSELANTPLRSLLYAIFELSKEADIDDVLHHLMENCPNYLPNKQLLAKIADYIAEKREGLKASKGFNPELEASSARVLAEAIRNQRL